MTVETTDSRAQYATNATTGPWTVPFYFLADDHLEVIYTDSAGNETTLTLTTDYSVSGAGDPTGGTVTTVTAYAAGGYITVLRSIEPLQQTDWVDGDASPAASYERAVDLLTMIVQQQAEVLNRALVFAPSDTAGSELPAVAARASKMLGFNSLGQVTMSVPADGTAASLALNLASAANSAVGAGMVGYGATLNYVAGTLGAKARERKSILDFGAVVDGVTDSTAAFAAARTWAAAQTKPPEIVFPAGAYLVTASPNWNINFLTLRALGQVEIHCTGAGPAMNIDGTAAWIYGAELRGSWIFTGNAACASALQIIKVSHGRFDPIRLRECTTAAAELKLLVCCRFDTLECSINADSAMVTKPARGMRLGSLGGLAATANTFVNTIMEGWTQGIELTEADFNLFLGGTAEACTTRGINVSTLSKGNRFVEFACEANTTEDVLNQGVGTAIEGGYFGKLINCTGALRARIRGVRAQSITLDATTANSSVEDCEISAFAAGGALTNAGTRNTLKRIYNVNLATFANFGPREWANPTQLFAALAPGASPYTYTNTTDFAEEIIVRNNVGTVTRVDAIDTGANLSVAGGAAGLTAVGTFWVMPGEGLKVTYGGGAIEMIRKPR